MVIICGQGGENAEEDPMKGRMQISSEEWSEYHLKGEKIPCGRGMQCASGEQILSEWREHLRRGAAPTLRGGGISIRRGEQVSLEEGQAHPI